MTGMYSGKGEIMKGIKTFVSQTEGLRYFTEVIINAANRGWFQTDEVKDLFRRELKNWGTGSAESIRRGADSGADHCICDFWGLVCLPIIGFFAGVVKGGDSATFCDFRWAIIKNEEKSVVGSVGWYGTATNGRFIRIVFTEDGGARMFYDTGYEFVRGEGYRAKGKSEFLSLPAVGDENLSSMGQDEFYRLAHSEANN